MIIKNSKRLNNGQISTEQWNLKLKLEYQEDRYVSRNFSVGGVQNNFLNKKKSNNFFFFFFNEEGKYY